MKQAKSIAFIGLAASLIVFAHYVGADDHGVNWAANRGLMTTGQSAQAVLRDQGQAGGQRLVPGQARRTRAHLEAAAPAAGRAGTQTDGCRLDFRGASPVTAFALIRLPAMICN